MTPRIEKTVFISYRRTNFPWALAIFQNLKNEGYDAFFDYLSIPSGDFENIIVENIKARAHFVVILTPSALERCNEPGDWLRREIETAIDEKRNIVPLMLESFDFGSPATVNALTGKLENLKKYNGLRLHSEYFFEGMNRLREQYLNVSLDSIIHPISESTKPATEEQQAAATDAKRVQKEELTAQEWFERGIVFQQDENFDEAHRCYSEAIRIDPTRYRVYNNLGILFTHDKRYAEAEAALRKAIELNPSDSRPSDNLKLLLEMIELESDISENNNKILDRERKIAERKQKIEDIVDDFRKSLKLNPTDAAISAQLVIVLRLAHKIEEVYPIVEKMIKNNPKDFYAHLTLASINKELGKDLPKENIKEARQLIPKDNWYEQACLECVCDNFDKAFEHLEKATKKEDFLSAWAWLDPNLQWLRNNQRFTEIVGAKPE